MKCEYELRRLLESWVNTGDARMDKAAVDAGVEIFRIFYVSHQIWIRDEVDRDFANDVTRAILDLSMALPLNPFWRANSASLNPLLYHTIQSWTASAKYMDRAMNPGRSTNPDDLTRDRAQALALQNSFLELMTAVLSLAVPDYFDGDTDMKIRDALLDFKERHLFET